MICCRCSSGRASRQAAADHRRGQSRARRSRRSSSTAAPHVHGSRGQRAGFGDRRQQMLEDVAILSGRKVITEESASSSNTQLSHLGHARRVVITRDAATIVDEPARATRSAPHQPDQDRDQHRSTSTRRSYRRLASCRWCDRGEGQHGDETEMKEKKHRVEDALQAPVLRSRRASSPVAASRCCTRRTRCVSRGSRARQEAGARIVLRALEAASPDRARRRARGRGCRQRCAQGTTARD